MVSRYIRAIAVALIVSTLMLLGDATSVSAADGTPAPTPSVGGGVIEYRGTGTATSANPGGGTVVTTSPVTWTVDCGQDPCTITGALTSSANGEVFQLTGGVKQPFVGGRGTYSYPESGDKCSGTWLPGYSLTIIASGNAITSSFDLPPSSQADCGDKIYVFDLTHVEITTTAISGDTCFIFASCATTPTAATTSGGGVSRGTLATDSSTLSALQPAVAALNPGNAVWAVAMTTVLIILIALPSQLINGAVERAAERWESWRRLRRPRPPDTREQPHAISWKGWPLAAAGVLLASLISGFVDPSFGFNPLSLRVFASILVSFVLDAVVGWFVIIWLVRRSIPSATASFRFVPATLAIVAAAVLFTRLTGFQPGIVFGLVAGVVFSAAVRPEQKARIALLPLAYSFGAAIVGWLGYSIIVAVAGDQPDPVTLFVRETFSALAIGGIAALPITLVPLRGLAGHAVLSWNRWVWAASYAIGLFGFFLILMPLPFSWASVSLGIWTWVGIYLFYAAISVALWLGVVRPWKPDEHAETGNGPADGEELDEPVGVTSPH